LEGLCIQKYQNGNISNALYSKNGNVTKILHMYPNGSLYESFEYKNEVLHGRYKKYNEEYTLIYDNVYKNGEFIEVYKEKTYTIKYFLFHILCLLLFLFPL
jgi:antitoxin component YwqK of YwqJK toxin-antitoxin module